MSNIFMSTENSKTSDPNRLRLYFTDKIDLRGNKTIALSDLSIHYTWHKTAGKKIIHKSAEVTGYLIGPKIADKITSLKENHKK